MQRGSADARFSAEPADRAHLVYAPTQPLSEFGRVIDGGFHGDDGAQKRLSIKSQLRVDRCRNTVTSFNRRNCDSILSAIVPAMKKLLNTLITSLAAVGRLRPEGAKYVRRVISSSPSREPGNRTRVNMIVDFISRKMGVTMAVESLSIEAAYALFLDTFSRCIAFFAQPLPLLVEKFDKHGRAIKQWVTFDFLVLFEDRIELVECKPEEKLAKLATDYPGLYARNDKGEWISPIYEKAAKQLGLKFRVVSSVDLPSTLTANFANLQPLVGVSYSSKAALNEIKARIPEVDGRSLAELVQNTNGKYEKNDVYKALLEQALFAPLIDQRLSDAKVVPIFKRAEDLEAYRFREFGNNKPEIDAAVIEVGKRLRWNETTYQIVNVTAESVSVLPPEGEVFDLPMASVTRGLVDRTMAVLTSSQIMHQQRVSEVNTIARHLSAKDVEKGMKRLRFLKARSANPRVRPGQFGLEKVTHRTIQRWTASFNQSVARYQSGTWGLYNKPRGGAGPSRLPQDIRTEMERAAEDYYFRRKSPSLRYAHRQLKLSLDQKHLPCPSYTAFRRLASRMKTLRERELLTKGLAGADKIQPKVKSSQPSWIRGSEYPMMVAQIDGKIIDVVLLDDETGEVLGRPVLTLITLPHYGSAPIGMALMFEKESSRSACVAIRDMVKRHGRGPGFLVVDNGKAFNSVAFDQLCAALEISKVLRPPKSPRFGSEIESFFRTLDLELAHNMEGNTKFLPKTRELSESHNPRKLAVWTLQDFYPMLEDYLFKHIWDAPSRKLGTSPRAAFERDKLVAPDSPDRLLISPENQELLFCPEVDRRGVRMIEPGRGVSLKGLRYWCSEMYDARVERTEVPVRYDPYDETFAYVQINGEWLRAEASDPIRIRNCTKKTNWIGVLAARALRLLHPKRREALHGVTLAKIGAKIETLEEVRIKERKDRADRLMRDAGQPTASTTVVKPPRVSAAHKRIKERSVVR